MFGDTRGPFALKWPLFHKVAAFAQLISVALFLWEGTRQGSIQSFVKLGIQRCSTRNASFETFQK